MLLESDLKARQWFGYGLTATAVVALASLGLLLGALDIGGMGAGSGGWGAFILVPIWSLAPFFLFRRARSLREPGDFIRAHLEFLDSPGAYEASAEPRRLALIARGLKILQKPQTPHDLAAVATAIVSQWSNLSDSSTASGDALREAADFGARYLPYIAPAERDTHGALTELAQMSCALLAGLGHVHLAMGDLAVARGLAERAPLEMQDLSVPTLWSCMMVRTIAYAGLGYRKEAERDYGRLYAADPSRTDELRTVYDAIYATA